MVDTYNYKVSQTHRMYNTKSKPLVEIGLWVTMVCQYKFINYNKYTILLEDIGIEECCACGGRK